MQGLPGIRWTKHGVRGSFSDAFTIAYDGFPQIPMPLWNCWVLRGHAMQMYRWSRVLPSPKGYGIPHRQLS